MVTGSYAQAFIELHDCMPLADFGKRETDAARDVAVLGANCQRVVHRNVGVCLSLEELRSLVDSRLSTHGDQA